LPLVKYFLLKLFSADTLGAMTLFIVCVVTKSARHTGFQNTGT